MQDQFWDPGVRCPLLYRHRHPLTIYWNASVDTIILRSRDKAFVHCIVGKEGMSDEEIAQNIEAVSQKPDGCHEERLCEHQDRCT